MRSFSFSETIVLPYRYSTAGQDETPNPLQESSTTSWPKPLNISPTILEGPEYEEIMGYVTKFKIRTIQNFTASTKKSARLSKDRGDNI